MENSHGQGPSLKRKTNDLLRAGEGKRVGVFRKFHYRVQVSKILRTEMYGVECKLRFGLRSRVTKVAGF